MRRFTFILLASIAGLVAQAQYSGSEADSLLHERGLKYFVNKDYEKALEIFNQLAQNDYAKAYDMLGWSYLYGLGVEKNYDKAYEYLKHSADLGYDGAMVNLGNAFYFSRLNDENLDGFSEWAYKKRINTDAQARKWFTMAAKGNGPNSSLAYYGLALMCYYTGCQEDSWGFNVDGLPFLRKSAELGNIDAMIGMAFVDEPSHAVSWLQKAKAGGAKCVTWNEGIVDITIDEMISILIYCESSKKWKVCKACDCFGCVYSIRHCGDNIVAKLDLIDYDNYKNYEAIYAVFSPKGSFRYTVGKPQYLIEEFDSYYDEDKHGWLAKTPHGDWVWLDLSGSMPRVIATEKKTEQ